MAQSKWGGPLIEAEVGESKIVVYIHPEVLSQCQKSPIEVQTKGSWNLNNNRLDWTDFELETIECFLEYLYTGDYQVPGIIFDGPSPPAPTHDDAKPTSAPATAAATTTTNPFPSPSTAPKKRLCTAAGLLEKAHAVRGVANPVGAMLLAHARLYVFAHRNFLPSLSAFSLQRLEHVFALFPGDRRMFPELAHAVALVYEHTPGPELADDPARRAMARYVAGNFVELAAGGGGGGGGGAAELMARGGELAADVSRELVGCLGAKDAEVAQLESKVAAQPVSDVPRRLTEPAKSAKMKAPEVRWEGGL